ncbi:hypothetical protein QCA50_015983 [Cerrena zonata]|uniref:Uncharacterized protein n=1 Tax=Cerrena zonata TaxID=2478898 RepID=A0AAW0FLA7_9APHY
MTRESSPANKRVKRREVSKPDNTSSIHSLGNPGEEVLIIDDIEIPKKNTELMPKCISNEDKNPREFTKYEEESLDSIASMLTQHNIKIPESFSLKELDTLHEIAKQNMQKLESLKAAQDVSPFAWSVLEDAYNAVFDDYTNTSQEILMKLEESFKQRVAWQDLVFNLDRFRSIHRLTNSERAITAKEAVINIKKQKMKRSASLIQCELGKFKIFE